MPSLPIEGLRPAEAQTNLIGIQGEPSTGKTTAALTFPNPIVFDCDKKLPRGTQAIPVWDDNFIRSYMKLPATAVMTFAIRKDFTMRWLRTEGPKIPADYTFIFDSYTTGVDNLHNLFVKAHPNMFMSKDNNYDALKAYSDKLLWNLELIVTLKSFPCTVILTFHEQAERDKVSGRTTGRFRPLATGQFKDQLGGHFGLLLRTVVLNKKDFKFQVKADASFVPQISPDYQFPPDVTYIEPTYAALESYRISR